MAPNQPGWGKGVFLMMDAIMLMSLSEHPEPCKTFPPVT